MGIPLEHVPEGDWSAVQRVVDKLRNVATVDTGNQTVHLRFGVATVTWPGGTPNSTSLAVNHGLGRTPVAVVATPAGTGGPQYIVVTQAISSTTFNAVMRDSTPANPALNTQRSFYWIAIG